MNDEFPTLPDGEILVHEDSTRLLRKSKLHQFSNRNEGRFLESSSFPRKRESIA